MRISSLRTQEEKLWQTIVKKIRVAVNKVEVSRLPAVKLVDKKPVAGKVSRADSKMASRAQKRIVLLGVFIGTDQTGFTGWIEILFSL